MPIRKVICPGCGNELAQTGHHFGRKVRGAGFRRLCRACEARDRRLSRLRKKEEGAGPNDWAVMYMSLLNRHSNGKCTVVPDNLRALMRLCGGCEPYSGCAYVLPEFQEGRGWEAWVKTLDQGRQDLTPYVVCAHADDGYVPGNIILLPRWLGEDVRKLGGWFKAQGHYRRLLSMSLRTYAPDVLALTAAAVRQARKAEEAAAAKEAEDRLKPADQAKQEEQSNHE